MNEPGEFEWDPVKAAGNLVKHGVSFEVASVLFADGASVHMDASQQGDGEVRRKAVRFIDGRLFTLVDTLRNGVIRVISARRSNTREARYHGHNTIYP